MKLKFLSSVIIIFAVVLMTGCGNSRSDKNTLTYWSSNNSYEIKFADYITKKWNSNDSVKISFQPVPEGQSSEEVILAAVVGETTPDIYSNMWQGDVEVYADAGILVPLDTLDGFMEFIYDRCDSLVVEEITSADGHIYQIPWKINPIMLIYNESIIENLQLDTVPGTYSQFTDAAEKFKKDIDGDGYIDRWFGYAEVQVTWWQRFFDFYPLYLAATGGGKLIENNQAAFNNEHAIAVFRFLRNLYANKYFAMERLSARQDVFLSGTIATRFTGPWEISHSEKYKPEGFNYNFNHIPVPDDHVGPIYTYADPKNIVIFNTCKHPETAWKFLKEMINEKNDLKLLEISNQLPRRKEIDVNPLFSEYFKANPKMKKFAAQAKYVKGTDASPVLKEVFDLISQQYESCVVYRMKSPEQAIQDAADAVNLLFLE
ncbi:MAG: extracellular solute-binding protein [Melioribacteraceae bacterium]|nr:extracellular solute-binding protein [Melioribacteraceae bacterium]MCF8353257.1 extracellular solute-binding protein [Melioribacteraceae bacterium]MCF8395571.1 extracellular solute-binding protein [Melioribacteraceae bacterium]MCF8418784.1 extracellular solute-binding protein [Melioribacteraceae bacterium]